MRGGGGGEERREGRRDWALRIKAHLVVLLSGVLFLRHFVMQRVRG
jgi:hypothetical protein